jgi:hypothetical protein
LRGQFCAQDVRPVVVPFSSKDRTAKSVLYISNTGREERPYFDPSVRYRCFNMAETGRAHGLKTFVATQAEVDAGLIAPEHDAYVFHRPRLTRGLMKFLQLLPKEVDVTADYDDLVFDVTAAEHTSAVKSRNTPVWRVRNAISENMGAMDLFERFTVSTRPLADAVARLRHDALVSVVPNVPDRGYISLARQLRARRDEFRRRRIGYFSGTNSHNEDFEYVSKHLFQFCARTDVELFVMGPVQIPATSASGNVRIKTSKVVSFQQMAMEVIACDAVIAPLVSSPFTDCKSGIKFMEAAVLGVPVVATPIPDIARFTSSLLCSAPSLEDWPEALSGAWNRDKSGDRSEGERVEETLLGMRIPHHLVQ